jgi:hypothetical protein
VLTLMLLALTVACSAHNGGIAAGTAIRAGGPPASGILGIQDAQVGKAYRFAFPLMHNTSKQSISITGVSVEGIPKGISVLGYPVYSVKDTPGYLLGYRDDSHDGEPNLDKYPNYAKHPFTIKAGAISDKYAMVRVRITGKVTKHLTGCKVRYTQAGVKYQQTVHCEYALDMK